MRKELRAWLRRLHDDVHVTTIFVTHDQEEAMDLADRIVVMSHGRVEQVGDPVELYEEPANEFVMTFVGEVNIFHGRAHEGKAQVAYARPHDLELLREGNGQSSPARIDRVVHLGFEVRVELALADGRDVWAQVTREEAQELALEPGLDVHIRPRRARVFS